jgi:hypothetical protein
MTDYSAAEKMLISSFGEFLRTVDEISHDRTVEVPLSKLLVAQTVIAATSDEVEELNEVLESSGIADSTSDILSPYLENAMGDITPDDEAGLKLSNAFQTFFMKMMLAALVDGVTNE